MKKIILIIALLIGVISANASDTTHITKKNYLIYNKVTKIITIVDTGNGINNNKHYLICTHASNTVVIQSATVSGLKTLAKSLNLVANKKENEFILK